MAADLQRFRHQHRTGYILLVQSRLCCKVVVCNRFLSHLSGCMGKYKYLPYIIVLICAEYFIILSCFVGMKLTNKVRGVFFDKTLDMAGGSWVVQRYGQDSRSSRIMEIVLLLYRLVAFVWLAAFGTIHNFVVDPSGWHWYTNWNIILISVYFLLAIIASILHISSYGRNGTDNTKTKAALWIGKIAGSSFGFVASTAIMVTLLNFSLLNAAMRYWNVVLHLTQTICILLDMSMNAMRVNPQELILAISWPFLYVIFIWPVVGSGERDWPYFFLEVSHSGAFVWYHVLFILSIIFFVLLWGIDMIKWKYVNEHTTVSNSSISPEELCVANAVSPSEGTNFESDACPPL